MNIWEVSDLKNLIDEFSGNSVIDLNQWAKKEMTEDQRNQLKTATLSVIDGARLALLRNVLFEYPESFHFGYGSTNGC